MQHRLDDSLASRRFVTLLLAMFAALALVLTSVGTYGVISYLVSHGTRDIGVRVALGATSRGVVAMVMRQGVVMAATGLAIGVAGALAITGALRALLFGVVATDVATYAVVATVLVATELIAIYIPARRAARIDPVSALRAE
jgi:ABC-type antimicrobial peptide transport system permease subunit